MHTTTSSSLSEIAFAFQILKKISHCFYGKYFVKHSTHCLQETVIFLDAFVENLIAVKKCIALEFWTTSSSFLDQD